MKIILYIMAVFPLFIVAGIYYFVISSLLKKRTQLNEIADRIGGKLKGGIITVGYVEGIYKTNKIKISLTWPSQYTPPQLIIEFFKKSPFKIKIKKRTQTHRFLIKLHLLREFNIGISDFDEKFFIRTNNEMFCMNYLSQNTIRTSIEQIINQHSSLLFLNDRIKLIKLCAVTKDEKREFIRNRSLKKLMAIQSSGVEKILEINSIMDVLENLYVLTDKLPYNSN